MQTFKNFFDEYKDKVTNFFQNIINFYIIPNFMGSTPILQREVYKQKKGTCFAYATAGVILSHW